MTCVVDKDGERLSTAIVDTDNRNRWIERCRGLLAGIGPEHADRTVRVYLPSVIPDINFAASCPNSCIYEMLTRFRNCAYDFFDCTSLPGRQTIAGIFIENIRPRMSV